MFPFDYGFFSLFALEINAITFTRSQDFTRTVSGAADTENPKAEASTHNENVKALWDFIICTILLLTQKTETKVP